MADGEMTAVPSDAVAPAGFVHLHVHTQFSVADATTRISDIVARCKAEGMSAVALTDHDNLYGAVDFYKACKKEGIKPILGAAISIAERPMGEHVLSRYQLNLLAMNQRGYLNLLYLLSQAHLRAPEGGAPRIDHALLEQYNEGLICLTGNLSGEIPMALLRGRKRDAERHLRRYMEIFGDRLYLECQLTNLKEHQRLLPKLLALGERHGVPCVATNDVHYLRPEDARSHEVLLSIGLQIQARPDPEWLPTRDYNFASPDEMRERFAGHEELCDRTVEIAARCDVELTLGKHFLPKFSVPASEAPNDALRQKCLEAIHKELPSDDADGETSDGAAEAREVEIQRRLEEALPTISYLERVCKEGLEERFAEFERKGLTYDRAVYEARLQVELEVIVGMNFPGYFLIVWDFIRWAKEEGIPVGPGRGSGAGSLVAYSLRITDLDPLPYGLLFERFLNPERVSMPDFDIDFCIDRRGDVIQYVVDKYGADQVGQIVTFGTLKAKGAVRDCGRVLAVDLSKTNEIASMIPDDAKNIADAKIKEPNLALRAKADPEVANLLATAEKLEGAIRQTGVHAAGVVISEGPLWDYVPVARGQKGENVAMFAKEPVEDAGLVKFDFLGLKNLTLIEHAVRLIHTQPKVDERETTDFDLSAIRLDDPKAFAVISAGKTAGVFQMESSGFTEMMKQMKPTEFTDIIAAGALYRPGPMGSGMHEMYIRRKHKQEAVSFDHQLLKPILEETYGAMVYQEQVMQIARDMAGYSLGGADMLRRAMGKKKKEEMDRHRELFCAGASERGIDRKVAEKIYGDMANFAEYGFNKSHAAAYGLITYQTAYLKAHYPACFFAALLTADKDNTDKVVSYIRAAKREAGLDVLPPDINESQLSFSVVKAKGSDTRKQIRFGLGAIRNVGEGAVESILEARSKGGPFESLFELCRRMDVRKVNKRVLEALVKCGAMDGFGESRATLYGNIDPAVKRAQQERDDKDMGQSSLFGAITVEDRYLPIKETWSREHALECERDVLGLYVSGHPVALYADRLHHLSCQQLTQARSPAVLGSRKFVKVNTAVMISASRVIRTRTGKEMAFVTIEDPSGQVEVVCYASSLDQCRPHLSCKTPVVATLGVRRDRRDENAVRIQIEALQPIEDAISSRSSRLLLLLHESQCDRQSLQRLNALLQQNHRWVMQYNQAIRDGRPTPEALNFGDAPKTEEPAKELIQGDVFDIEAFRHKGQRSTVVIGVDLEAPKVASLSAEPIEATPVQLYIAVPKLGGVTIDLPNELSVFVDHALKEAISELIGADRMRSL